MPHAAIYSLNPLFPLMCQGLSLCLTLQSQKHPTISQMPLIADNTTKCVLLLWYIISVKPYFYQSQKHPGPKPECHQFSFIFCFQSTLNIFCFKGLSSLSESPCSQCMATSGIPFLSRKRNPVYPSATFSILYSVQSWLMPDKDKFFDLYTGSFD